MTAHEAIKKIKDALYMVGVVEVCHFEQGKDAVGREIIIIKLRFKRQKG